MASTSHSLVAPRLTLPANAGPLRPAAMEGTGETDSPLEGGGFELPVPDERGYGLAFVCRVMGLLFGAQLLGFGGLTP